MIFADEVRQGAVRRRQTTIGSLSEDVLTLTFNSLSKATGPAVTALAGWWCRATKSPPGLHRGPEHALEHAPVRQRARPVGRADGAGGYQSINELVEGGGLRKQRDLAYELITAIPGVTCRAAGRALHVPAPDPAVYPIEDDQQFFLELLQETKVMLVQGTGSTGPARPFPHRVPAP